MFKNKNYYLLCLRVILMLFFLYYISNFCHVYQKTQISWIYDILLSYFFSFLFSLGVSFIFSIFYIIAYKNKIKILYNITLLVYNYM